MLKALLVDDEINILRNLQKVIPWEEIGFEIVGLAGNGVKALQLAEEHRPDLVLSDIRMPVMDGITFVEKLRELTGECECVMLTGYQDFEYARSVMRFGVKEYMLKPIDYEELEQVVRRAASAIRIRRQEARSEERKWGSVVGLAYEKILYDFLMDYTSVAAHPLLAAEELQLDELEYALLLVDLDRYSQLSLGWSEEERKLWNFAIRNVLQEALAGEKKKYAVLQMREGEWCLLIEHPKGDAAFDGGQALRWAELVREAVGHNVKLGVCIGICPRPVSADRLSVAYKSVQRSVSLAPGEGLLIAETEEAGERRESVDFLWQLVEAIVSGLKQCDRRQTEEALQSLNRHLRTIPDTALLRVQQILHFLVLHLLREMREMDVLPQTQEEAIWGKLGRCMGAKDLLAVMNELINQCLQVVVGKKSSVVLMISAKDYIDKKLSADLGIDELADYLGISGSYFSLLFKQHFGVTFVEYVTKLRMETAKSMLAVSDRSVTQIGESVGYLERRYFTKVFQKYTGMTPSEYRESKKPADS
ncbi:response regulator [Paenibacillus contaminans]|uniref:Two-component system response regulator n=1 Tax=Paenibacillus contaminans TaxID=450362 RepID=A0A329MVD1_9BACL|nr:response regulator [Paenibacillus contaminans]RAV21907.1 two-component system response regulator [Paenibacillus contaminans]